MTNELIQLKIKQRLNKLDSEDFDNLFCWQIQEAFNKAQREWVRRQLNGINQKRESRESSSQKITDLRILLVKWTSLFVDQGIYFESCAFPEDSLIFSRISAKAKAECCPPRPLVIYQASESDVDLLLKDTNRNPNFEWGETFSTIFANKIRIYTNNKFEIVDPEVVYYRIPTPIQFLGCTNTETGLISNTEVLCEFEDSVVELIIDDTAAILSGDLNDMNQMQRNQQNEQHNT